MIPQADDELVDRSVNRPRGMSGGFAPAPIKVRCSHCQREVYTTAAVTLRDGSTGCLKVDCDSRRCL